MKTSHLVHQERMDGVGKYLAPLLNLLNARGANMVIYGMYVCMYVCMDIQINVCMYVCTCMYVCIHM